MDRMRSGKGNYGFDASRCEYVDLVEAGIIDATKVVRIALENAVSVVSVLLLAEGTLTELSEEEKRPRQRTRHWSDAFDARCGCRFTRSCT